MAFTRVETESGRQASAGERFWFNGARMTILASGADSGGHVSVIHVEASQGRATPLHTDPNYETFVILHGTLAFWIGGSERVAAEGDTVVVPRGIPHAFLVQSPAARFLVINTPSGERFFLDGGVRTSSSEPPPPSSDDRDRLNAAAANNGVVILGPPPFAGDATSPRV